MYYRPCDEDLLMSPLVLDSGQHKVVTEAYHEARNFGASPREMKALGEALWVESKARNLSYGDSDSRGPLQQRPSQGWLHPQNVKLAVRDFLTHARANHGMQGSAGQLAQSVQRSAYPGRYDAAASIANQLQRHSGGDPSAGSATAAGGGIVGSYSLLTPNQTRTITKTVDDPAATKRVALAQYLQQTNPKSMLLRLGIVDPLEPVTKTVERHLTTPGGKTTHLLTSPGMANTVQHGVVHFGDKKVAAWIAPALEYAKSKGWKGNVESGFRTRAEQEHIYNSGVRPAAKPGTSNHEFTAFPGGAIDVSDAEQLSHILRSSKYAKLLVWAGSKDPVHFSHPHNGSY